MDQTLLAQLAKIVEDLARELRAANGDKAKEEAAVRAAVAAVESSNAPSDLGIAELLRDGHGDIEGAPDIAGASDEEYERWSDLLADACGY